jgi:hypothetical protein
VNHSVSDRECVRGAGSRLLRRGRLASCLSLALCVWLSPAVARSADSAAPPVTAAARKDDAETLKKARDLTRAGLERFESGDYDSAIAHFRAAYALLPAAKLLYNLAQAERLKGDMKSACESYRAFLALEPEGRLSALAREHREQCLEAQPPPAPVSEAAAEVPSREAPPGPVVAPAQTPRANLALPALAPRREQHSLSATRKGAIVSAASAGLLFVLGGYFGWRAQQASNEVSSLFDERGQWSAQASKVEQQGRRDERLALAAAVSGVVTAGVGLWLWTW